MKKAVIAELKGDRPNAAEQPEEKGELKKKQVCECT